MANFGVYYTENAIFGLRLKFCILTSSKYTLENSFRTFRFIRSGSSFIFIAFPYFYITKVRSSLSIFLKRKKKVFFNLDFPFKVIFQRMGKISNFYVLLKVSGKYLWTPFRIFSVFYPEFNLFLSSIYFQMIIKSNRMK